MRESNDRRIDDATPDADVTGAEKIPVSDGGTPKFATIEQIKDFVATKFAAFQNATDVSVNSDGVYLKKGGELKPVAANVFADAIISYMFGKEAETELAKTDEIVISSSGTVKIATIDDIANVVKDIVQFDAIDIPSMEQWDLYNDEDAFLLVSVKTGDTERENKKLLFANLINWIWQHPDISVGQPMYPEDTEIVVCNPTGSAGVLPTIKSVPISEIGLGQGDVKGPSSNVDGHIPKWNGTDTNTLADGYGVQTTLGSSDTMIPTGRAVKNVTDTKVVAPGANTADKIPQWDGSNTKRLKDGLSVIGSETGIGSSVTDHEVPTAKAIKDYVDGLIPDTSSVVKGPQTTTDGNIPIWGQEGQTPANRMLLNGVKLETDTAGTGWDNAAMGNIPTIGNIISKISSRIKLIENWDEDPYSHPENYFNGQLLFYTGGSGNPSLLICQKTQSGNIRFFTVGLTLLQSQ